MCGLAGIYNYNVAPVSESVLRVLHCMLGNVRHRGPEAAGIFAEGPVALGHDRLSIVDLEGGLQPLQNEDGSVWAVCNGEIFNHIELRRDLELRGHRFRTHSDVEVILHLYEEKGPGCLDSLNGQFSLALWDSRHNTMLLARDRLGIRPLFYTEVDNRLLFASEIKALFADGRVKAELNPTALDQVFTYWAALPGYTAFRGIHELPPGHYMTVTPGEKTLTRYWSLDFTQDAGEYHSEGEYAERLLELLIDATKLRLRADVPVGAYLSGGLDSSAISAIVKRYTGTDLQTFSIAFSDPHFDERGFQEKMAAHLGTRHTSIECTDADIAKVFPHVVLHAETPILRTAPAPMFLLSGLVRQHGLKVVLTGEGSDELFGGYDIFKEALVRRFWSASPDSKVRPLLLKRLYGDVQGIGATSQAYLEAFFRNGLTETEDPAYSHLVRWRGTSRIKRLFNPDLRAEITADNGSDLRTALDGISSRWDPLSKAQFVESRTFLSQYLLSSQGDRMGMAHAVEGRFPFLDYRLAEFAAKIPARMRLRGFDEKYILKRAISDLLPREVLERTKRPYRAPIRNAFFGPDAPAYVAEALSPEALDNVGVFDPRAVHMLVRKGLAAPHLSEADSMALVGVLSTQLLHKTFVQEREQWTRTPGFTPVTVCREPDLETIKV